MNSIRNFACLTLLALALLAAGVAQGEPLHTYLTYSGAPETSIDINIILSKEAESVDVYYDIEARTEPAAYAHHVKAEYVQTPMELSDRRMVYVAALKDLTPGTVYHFMTSDEVGGPSKPRKFRTLPGGTAPFRFVNGGDMGAGAGVVSRGAGATGLSTAEVSGKPYATLKSMPSVPMMTPSSRRRVPTLMP